MANHVMHTYDTTTEVQDKLCDFIIKVANEAIQKTGSFFLAVSGGSLMNTFCKGLTEYHANHEKYDFNAWVIFLADERHVEHSDQQSTYGYYKKHFVKHVKLENFFATDVDVDVDISAETYDNVLLKWALKLNKHVDDYPQFDLVLLGMGPDGHTCSLFPGHKLVKESNNGHSVQYIKDSPKEPPQRVTLSMRAVNNARKAAFMCLGESKAAMIKRITIDKDMSLPCTMVDLKFKGEIHWFIDQLAGSCL